MYTSWSIFFDIWYFVLKTQLLIESISKSNKALDYVQVIFINQPFLGKSFIILDIKSITQINIQSRRSDNLRPLHRSLLQPQNDSRKY